jgi:hypothetical protein
MSDFTAKEQSHVRAALNFLRLRCDGWGPLAKALRVHSKTLSNIGRGAKTPSPLIAFRVAKFASVGVDDVLTGRFPTPGTCPHCGHAEIPENTTAT